MNRNIEWDKLENWKNAFDALEERDYDKVVVKYLNGKEIVKVLGQQFYKDVHKNASVICRLGLQGSHIGLVGETSYDLLVNFCAILYTGSVAVVISKDYSSEELEKYGKLAEINALIFDSYQENICLQTNLNIKLISIKSTDASGVMSMEKEREKSIVPVNNKTKKDDMVNISFTSGTTGNNKAVMHTNGTLLAGAFPEIFYGEFSSLLLVFPFHHATGFELSLVSLCQGKTLCIGNDFQNIYRYLNLLKPECILLVPAVLQLICQKLKHNTQEELGWNLKVLVCGGAKCPINLLQIVLEHNIIMQQAYGSTETLGRGITCIVTPENLDSIGKDGNLIESKLVDRELVLKGPSLCVGYYNNPEETASTFIDGWYYTGDLARIDENGMYYLTGRKKNLIILTNGENISPEEIEQKLIEHNEIGEILIREERDFIGAVIFPNYPESINEEEKILFQKKIDGIVENYNESVPSYKRIEFITYAKEPLPKTASGKIIRHHLLME